MLASGVTLFRTYAIDPSVASCCRPVAGGSGPERRAVWGPLPPPSLRPRPRAAVLAPAGGLRSLVIAIGRAAAAVGVRRGRVAVAPLGVHQLRELKAMQSQV